MLGSGTVAGGTGWNRNSSVDEPRIIGFWKHVPRMMIHGPRSAYPSSCQVPADQSMKKEKLSMPSACG